MWPQTLLSGFGDITPPGTTIKYRPTAQTGSIQKHGDSQTVSTYRCCISAMKEYENKSLEELRYEDYIRRKQVPQKTTGVFGAAQTTAPSFCAQSSSTATDSLFESTTENKSLFGQPSTSTESAAPLPAFATSAQPETLLGEPTSGFGKVTIPTSRLSFGNTTTPASPFPSGIFNQAKPFGVAAPQTTSLIDATATQPETNFGVTPNTGFSSFAPQPNQSIDWFNQNKAAFNMASNDSAKQCACIVKSPLDIKNSAESDKAKIKTGDQNEFKNLSFEGMLDAISNKLENIANDTAKIDKLQRTVHVDRPGNKMLEEEDQVNELKEWKSFQEAEIEELQIYTRRNNLIITCLPDALIENDCYSVVMDIANYLRIPLDKREIDIAHPLHVKKGCRVLVKFVCGWKKEQLLSAYIQQTKKKIINTQDLKYGGPKTNIYIAEHLTPQAEKIYFQARQLKKEKAIETAHTRNGKVIIREVGRREGITINHIEELEKYTPEKDQE